MLYEEFINKWVSKSLYDDGLKNSLSGSITMFENQEINISYGKVLADIFEIPKWHGWKDDKQRRDFYKDAKIVGVRVKKGEKNEWYKVKDLL